MSDVINTESKLFKMYAAHRVRKLGWGDAEDVLKLDADTINICSYSRGIALDFGYHFMIALLKFLGGLILSFMVLTPLLSIGFWLFTDNPFIVWFGDFGKAMLGVDCAILLIAAYFGACWVWDEHIKKRFKTGAVSAYKMSNMDVAKTWIKAKHGKFCHRLTFDRPSTKIKKKKDEEVKGVVASHDHEWPRE